jgi:hypothetical protein
LVERKDRIKQLVSQIDDVTLQKGIVVLEYAVRYQDLREMSLRLTEQLGRSRNAKRSAL